jgi:hypothetical protein
MTWNYRVVSKVTFDSYMKWYSVNVTVESDNGQQVFCFIYHNKPEEKTVKVCMNRALRAFCLHQLDDLNNPFDKDNEKAFGYNTVQVTQKDEEECESRLVEVAKEYKDTPKSLKENAYLGWENNSLKPDKEPSIRNNFLDHDKKANDFDEDEE